MTSVELSELFMPNGTASGSVSMDKHKYGNK